MHIEAFTEAKDPLHPGRNEDRLVCYEGRLFAVVDGVTDKSGMPLPDGRTRGQAAGRLIEATLRDLVDDGGVMSEPIPAILNRFVSAFQAEYDLLGLQNEVTVRPELRLGAQLAFAACDDAQWRFVVVGDCGIRIDERTVLTAPNEADSVIAWLRSTVFQRCTERGATTEASLAAARTYAVHGMSTYRPEHADAVPEPDFRALRRTARADAPVAFPHLPPELVLTLVNHGILGAGHLRNVPGPLGQACIDGTAVPTALVLERRLPRSEVRSIELFTDGYFGVPSPEREVPARMGASEREPPHPTVAEWERHFALVEREDPFKIGRFASTKGSLPGKFTDDRTVLVLRP
jgi:hypothetical protein